MHWEHCGCFTTPVASFWPSHSTLVALLHCLSSIFYCLSLIFHCLSLIFHTSAASCCWPGHPRNQRDAV